jgi:hypothetical protein
VIAQQEGQSASLTEWLQANWNRTSLEHFYMTAYAMLQSGEPQLVIVTETNHWDSDSFPAAHA